jgi:hypothetical protein
MSNISRSPSRTTMASDTPPMTGFEPGGTARWCPRSPPARRTRPSWVPTRTARWSRRDRAGAGRNRRTRWAPPARGQRMRVVARMPEARRDRSRSPTAPPPWRIEAHGQRPFADRDPGRGDEREARVKRVWRVMETRISRSGSVPARSRPQADAAEAARPHGDRLALRQLHGKSLVGCRSANPPAAGTGAEPVAPGIRVAGRARRSRRREPQERAIGLGRARAPARRASARRWLCSRGKPSSGIRPKARSRGRLAAQTSASRARARGLPESGCSRRKRWQAVVPAGAPAPGGSRAGQQTEQTKARRRGRTSAVPHRYRRTPS